MSINFAENLTREVDKTVDKLKKGNKRKENVKIDDSRFSVLNSFGIEKQFSQLYWSLDFFL